MGNATGLELCVHWKDTSFIVGSYDGMRGYSTGRKLTSITPPNRAPEIMTHQWVAKRLLPLHISCASHGKLNAQLEALLESYRLSW